MVLPTITEDLILYLERLYPDRFPDGEVSLTKTSRLQGQVEVVRHLRSVFNQQIENSLKGDLSNVLLRQSITATSARNPTTAPANPRSSSARY